MRDLMAAIALESPWFAAFAARPRPPEDALVETSEWDDGAALRARLASTAPNELTPEAVLADVEGQLWLLTPETFRYFLPGLMAVGVAHYRDLGSFVADLVTALTAPERRDIEQALDRYAEIQRTMDGVGPAGVDLLRSQQLAWFDSGAPRAKYEARVSELTPAEGAAVLDFLTTLQSTHGEDFPFHEIAVAIERHWGRFAPAAGASGSPPAPPAP
jgi:hypothetical protein